ncbi:MAG: hypothetical protein JW940_05855 [Polyangiaceae bacterium]|nr:hypothetical protein [Polyangiaceae bacterium]
MRLLHQLRFVALLVGLLVVSAACQRKAPGPASCRSAAMRMLGVDESVVASLPQLEDALNALTIECLTTPYDRAFVDCMRHIPTPLYGGRFPGHFRCLALRSSELATECIRQSGPGRACYVEFTMRYRQEAGVGDSR